MTENMLIDAVHPEEIRVAVVGDSRLEEFDFETSAKKQIKSNIYLGKVTRVEPSLQAAFVEYGGNKQGFLPFSEIHYDYYQIPVADKEKLAAELSAATEAEIKAREEVEEKREKDAKKKDGDDKEESAAAEIVDEEMEEPAEDGVEVVSDDVTADARYKRRNLFRQYKIQEVLKRNQIVLVQVIKEERGNKGASLTTYISLAGRYCVLMPNTDRQGGVSRRISDFNDRKRMKEIVSNLEMPKGASVIVRTAGVERTNDEIKKDFDYLTKLWNDIRKKTVDSSAPALIYEEGDIIKRSLRDLYRDNIKEILVEGADAYKDAKEFLKMMAPAHAKKIKEYKESDPILKHYKVDSQLDELYENTARLESGGSIVITPTEALVSIDVNSGKSTRSRSIEETALKTNTEAAIEIARQLRLRDLAGLVVIDFIDMRELRNRRAIERALKDALKADRAKIQVGRISLFGLLEMSRQRMRSSLVESSTSMCPLCKGRGVVRSSESTAVRLLRAIEAEAMKENIEEVNIRTSTNASFYLLNNKRPEISSIEEKFGVKVLIDHDHNLSGADFTLDKAANRRRKGRKPARSESVANDGEKKWDSKKPDRKPRPSAGPKRNPKPKNPNSKTEETEEDDNIGNKVESNRPAPQKRGKPTASRKAPYKPGGGGRRKYAGNNMDETPSSSMAEESSTSSDDESGAKLKGLWKKITK